jgi:hypothetical protein
VRFYEGKEGLRTILDDILQSRAQELLTISSGKIFEVFRSYFPEFIKQRARKGMKARVLQERSLQIEELTKLDENEMREIRFLSSAKGMNVMIQIYENKTAFLTLRENAHVGVVIENRDISESQRHMFEKLWESAGRPLRQQSDETYQHFLEEMETAKENRRFIVINDKNECEEIDFNTVVQRIAVIPGKELQICYESHLGFKIPHPYFFAEIIKQLKKNCTIWPHFIDERERSGGKTFMPTEVYVKGKTVSLDVSQDWISRIKMGKGKLDVETILEIYRQNSYKLFLRMKKLIGTRKASSLGEFLVLTHTEILKEGLQGIPNATIESPHFYQMQKSGKTGHTVADHNNHDVVFLAVHTLSTEKDNRLLKEFIKRWKHGREEKLLKDNPKYIIIQKLPDMYCDMIY